MNFVRFYKFFFSYAKVEIEILISNFRIKIHSIGARSRIENLVEKLYRYTESCAVEVYIHIGRETIRLKKRSTTGETLSGVVRIVLYAPHGELIVRRYFVLNPHSKRRRTSQIEWTKLRIISINGGFLLS